MNRPDIDVKKIDQLDNLKKPKYFTEEYEIVIFQILRHLLVLKI